MNTPKPMKGHMDKGGNYGLKKGGASTGYSPKQCPPLPNLGATPTNGTKKGGGYK